MALQTLAGAGLWVPSANLGDVSISNGTYIIDATGEQAAVILRCPKAGDLDRFDFLIGTVTNSPDNGLRASFQGVSAATGLPDGTVLGATNNAKVTYAHTVTTGWKSTNFGETVTVTRNQLIACVVDIPSFTAGDSVALSHIVWSETKGNPYGVSATSTKQRQARLIIALHYTDGYAFLAPAHPGIDTHPVVAYNVNTATADEWGMAFQVPFPCKLNAVEALFSANAAGADFELLVYDASDVVIATLTQDGDVMASTGVDENVFFLQSELTLTANTTYRVTLRPTTTNQLQLRYFTFQSLALMDTIEGGQNFYMTSRLNQAGSWTNYNSGTFRRPRIALHLTAFDDAVSAGGMVRHPGMAGNLNG